MSGYTGVAEVRQNNSGDFIKDFKRARSLVAFCHKSQMFLPVLKVDVWAKAKTREIRYTMDIKVYIVDRVTMVIL